jgi:Tol biopolymer transport system component
MRFSIMNGGDFTLSADGNVFVYRGADENGSPILWQRRMDELRGKPIPNTELAARPKISPNSSEIVFNSGGRIRVASLRGGLTRTLVETGADSSDWSPDGALGCIISVLRARLGGCRA